MTFPRMVAAKWAIPRSRGVHLSLAFKLRFTPTIDNLFADLWKPVGMKVHDSDPGGRRSAHRRADPVEVPGRRMGCGLHRRQL